MVQLVLCKLDSAVQKRHIFDDAVDLDAAGRSDDYLRFGVVNANR